MEPQTKPVGHTGRKKFKEIRQKLQVDDEDCPNTNITPPNSQTSSVEGVCAANRTSHPFRIIEHDTLSLQSLSSLGRVGRILGGMSDNSKLYIVVLLLQINLVYFSLLHHKLVP